jgi:bis(5'-nucleosyl)-tetraphosphatase (symmetrical)
MSTYAIGDIQGCFATLQALLEHVAFDESRDRLWLTGDLVNRGPSSLEVLHFARNLGEKCVVTLGNHDLHLLAVAERAVGARTKDTFDDVLRAPDRESLLDWLSQQPLVHFDEPLGYVMVHAGFAPQWDLETALELGREVSQVVRTRHRAFFKAMYGNEPDRWRDDLTGLERLRVITNYLTRLRFCTASGRIDFENKGPPNTATSGYLPWYAHPGRKLASQRIVFGHWASLMGQAKAPNVFALDTGCVWRRQLTALELETGALTSVDCCEDWGEG